MGIDYHIHVGPYIKVKETIVKQKEEFYSCINIFCKNHKKHIADKFCNECGKKIELFSHFIDSSIDFDVYEEFDEKFCEGFSEYKPNSLNGFRIFISNKSDKLHESFNVKYDCFESSYTGEEINKKLVLFCNKYSKEINKIESVFGGEQNVSIHWGVLSWIS